MQLFNLFIHRFTSNHFVGGLGFKLRYEATKEPPQMTYRISACGGNFTTPNGILTSPSYPENYPDSSSCFYTISRPTNTYLNLHILIFDLHYTYHCDDYLEIRDGISEDSPLIGKFCGNTFPQSIQTTQSKVWTK